MSTYRSDCSRCAGLCCVALPFARSADFPEDKAGGDPCRHLGPDFGCGVHDQLRERGYAGCTVFECFGAGQQVTQVTFGGADWRTEPALRQNMFDVFAVMRQLHEMLALLEEAAGRSASPDLAAVARPGLRRGGRLRRPGARHRPRCTPLGGRRRRSARSARRYAGPRGRPWQEPTSSAADLRRRDLRRADLRSALLVAADLRGVDLADADLLGADLRDAAVAGADLSRALFLTQAQVNALRGDGTTRLPAGHARPAHWS